MQHMHACSVGLTSIFTNDGVGHNNSWPFGSTVAPLGGFSADAAENMIYRSERMAIDASFWSEGLRLPKVLATAQRNL